MAEIHNKVQDECIVEEIVTCMKRWKGTVDTVVRTGGRIVRERPR